MDNDIKVTFDETEGIKVSLDDTSQKNISTKIDVGSIQYGQLEIGTTTTGEAGTEASVKNTGSSAHAILDFTIPKGKDGKSGVWVGSEEPPSDEYNVWVDESGEEDKFAYESLEGLPSINGVELIGNLTTDDLGIEAGGSDIGILTEFDIEKTYEDNEVYNANAIHQLMEIFGFEIMNIMEFIENHEERISILENK